MGMSQWGLNVLKVITLIFARQKCYTSEGPSNNRLGVFGTDWNIKYMVGPCALWIRVAGAIIQDTCSPRFQSFTVSNNQHMLKATKE